MRLLGKKVGGEVNKPIDLTLEGEVLWKKKKGER